jgi:hypothetical protein
MRKALEKPALAKKRALLAGFLRLDEIRSG